jgi:hypothetical protein
MAVYGLDPEPLRRIAADMGPTMHELRTPIDAVPEGASAHAFHAGTTGRS